MIEWFSKKKIEYNPMYPPFEVKDFYSMNKEKAKQYFEWFISEIPKRLSYLDEVCTETGYKNILDFSPSSLVKLWTWFSKYIKESDTKEKDVKMTDYLSNYNKESGCKDLSYQTKVMIMDISIYYSEVIRRNKSDVNWGYVTKPKDFISVNQPILLGKPAWFKFDSTLIVTSLCYDFLDGNRNPSLLLETYEINTTELV